MFGSVALLLAQSFNLDAAIVASSGRTAVVLMVFHPKLLKILCAVFEGAHDYYSISKMYQRLLDGNGYFCSDIIIINTIEPL